MVRKRYKCKENLCVLCDLDHKKRSHSDSYATFISDHTPTQ